MDLIRTPVQLASNAAEEGRRPGSAPSAYTEKAWWSHLPAELRWFAERDAA